MKKGYQKRIDNLSSRLFEENAESLENSIPFDSNSVDSNSFDSTPTLEELPQIENLDEILELPQPLREISFVKAICDGHKNRKRSKTTLSERRLTAVPELAAWQESSKDTMFNSQN